MLDKTSGNKIAEGKILLDHMDKIHTTEMGVERIKKNLKIEDADVVEYCASLGEIYDIVIEDTDRQSRGLNG